MQLWSSITQFQIPIKDMGISYSNALNWMSQDFTDDNITSGK